MLQVCSLLKCRNRNTLEKNRATVTTWQSFCCPWPRVIFTPIEQRPLSFATAMSFHRNSLAKELGWALYCSFIACKWKNKILFSNSKKKKKKVSVHIIICNLNHSRTCYANTMHVLPAMGLRLRAWLLGNSCLFWWATPGWVPTGSWVSTTGKAVVWGETPRP